MLKIIVAATITMLSVADGSVLQTGQVKSYNADGNIVPYGSIKDDGYYRAGAIRSYSRIGDLVMDNATGLQWQDNLESVLKPWVTEANLIAGHYFDTSGDTATTYCGCLTLGGHGDWRLPSIMELQTLVDYSQYNPAAAEGIFNHIFLSRYWSSTTVAKSIFSAWLVYFPYGYSTAYIKNANFYVRCVRGGHLSPLILSRNGEIVTDSATGLQWQDDSAAGSTQIDWSTAIDYCENPLTLGGHSDWRLPNINELLSIVNFSRYDPALTVIVFQNYASEYYWSSTTTVDDTSNVWHVRFSNGNTDYDGKLNAHHVRCVRGGQVNIPVNPAIIMYLLD